MSGKHGPATERFWSKVFKTPTCWEWTASKIPSGYGRFNASGHAWEYAHRFSYQLIYGDIPDGLEIDHLCRNRGYVNPSHLEPVTHAVNCQRGNIGRIQRLKTHCPRGHPYDSENTRLYRNGRYCRACSQLKCQQRRDKKPLLDKSFN